jgi:hypothetical protein
MGPTSDHDIRFDAANGQQLQVVVLAYGLSYHRRNCTIVEGPCPGVQGESTVRAGDPNPRVTLPQV